MCTCFYQEFAIKTFFPACDSYSRFCSKSASNTSLAHVQVCCTAGPQSLSEEICWVKSLQNGSLIIFVVARCWFIYFWICFILTGWSFAEFSLTITSRLLGLQSLTALSVAMRAKTCLSALAFDAAYYPHLWLHLLLASKKTRPQLSATGELTKNRIMVGSICFWRCVQWLTAHEKNKGFQSNLMSYIILRLSSSF